MQCQALKFRVWGFRAMSGFPSGPGPMSLQSGFFECGGGLVKSYLCEVGRDCGTGVFVLDSTRVGSGTLRKYLGLVRGGLASKGGLRV